MPRLHVTVPALLAALLCAAPAAAQFDPAKVTRESPAVAARFPDPAVRYDTPSLREGRADFASHAEVLAWLDAQAQRAPQRLRIETLGRSQRGLAMPMAVLTARGTPDPALPTVLVIGQQHGNEPAGGEAALALVERLLGARAELLARANVLVIPRANPDGAERFVRATPSGVDVNRDHLLLRTPEAQAIAAAVLKYRPQVVLDLHEFTVAGRWVDKFGAVQKYDALVQAAGVGNLDPALAAAAQAHYVDRLQAVWAAEGLSSFAYHTTSPDARDKVVSMGGVQPDTGRNTNGLKPAISLLIEGRGVGLGRAHFLRRVHTQALAALAVVETAGAQGAALIALVRDAGARTAAQACRGELVIAARHSLARQRLTFLDATSGAELPLEVDWRAAAPLDVQRARPRPCGYLLRADQAAALERLRRLGVQVQPVAQAGRWALERYAVQREGGGQRQDARGAIDDGEGGDIRLYEVATEAVSEVRGPGSVYVPLDQPMGALVAAALEPDSQSSFAANRLVELEGLRRVTARPAAALLGPAAR